MSGYDEELQEFHRSLDRRSWRKSASPPPKLFHYTSGEGLLGIVQSHKLWATNVHFLNDSSETIYARELIDKILEFHLEDEKRERRSEVVIEFLKQARSQFFPDGWFDTEIVFSDGMNVKTGELLNPKTESYDIYVACFCEQPDLLSQWRGYGSTGGGYAIGFELLRFGPQRNPTPFYMARIEYSESNQKAIVGRIVHDFCEAAHQIGSKPQGAHRAYVIRELCVFLRGELSSCLLRFKNPAFAEEKEWRFIFIQSRKRDVELVRFRHNRNIVVPYIELEMVPEKGPYAKRLPISHIVCGPAHQQELTARSLKMLLNKHGYGDVVVINSKVPLRG